MEPMASSTELMLRFYQNALYLISWVFTFAGLVGACAYGLLIYSECNSGPHRKVKASPRTAPESGLSPCPPILLTRHLGSPRSIP